MAIYPSGEQIQALLADPSDGPVVMLNLLRYKPSADEPCSGMTGEEAYRLYGEKMVPFVESKGARVLWMGRVNSQVIGTGGEDFDQVALVEYPSRKVFVEIAMSPHVAEIGVFRTAGLEMQWLLATTQE